MVQAHDGVLSKDDTRRVTAAKINVVHKAFINQCDEKDGLKDGIVSEPEECSFDPGIIQCKETDGNDCLTAPQVEGMRQVYDGARNPRTGEQILAGFQPGSEQQLMALIGGKEPFPAAISYFRDVVFNNPQWDYKSFDYDKDLAPAYRIGNEILGKAPERIIATNPLNQKPMSRPVCPCSPGCQIQGFGKHGRCR